MLSFIRPPAPPDRDTEVWGITYKVVAASRRPLMLDQVVASTAWVGLAPPATKEEVKRALHMMAGLGTLHRDKGDTHMWAYSLPEGGDRNG